MKKVLILLVLFICLNINVYSKSMENESFVKVVVCTPPSMFYTTEEKEKLIEEELNKYIYKYSKSHTFEFNILTDRMMNEIIIIISFRPI